MTATPAKPLLYRKGWNERGYGDAVAGKTQRAPLRDDDGVAFAAYMEGYRHGRERRKEVS